MCHRYALLLLVSLFLYVPPSYATTIVVSTSGDDTAAGTDEKPMRTIGHAAEMAMPGDTVLVRAGVYRERVSPPRGGKPGKPITYRGEKLGKVFIRGSDLWQPKWAKHSGSVYFAVPDESMFTDDVYFDSPNPFRVEMASTPSKRQGKYEHQRFGFGDPDLVYTCGQVIVDGKLWTQVPFLKEVEAESNSWHFDPESGRLYVNFGRQKPMKRTVETTTRRRNFAPHKFGLGHIVVEGFVMEHCGNNYPTNFWSTPIWAQAGALGMQGGHHWVVRDNMIRYANTVAIDIGRNGGNNQRKMKSDASRGPRDDERVDDEYVNKELAGNDNLIESNYFIDNGAAGLIGSGSLRIVIRDNVILRNNTLGFVGQKRYEHAGIKCHGIRDGLIERNYIADNPRNDGIWLDNQFPGTRVTRNIIVNNGVKGIFLEMSDEGWDSAYIDHNIVIGNKQNQFYVHDASGATVMHNLFANSPEDSSHGQGTFIYQVTARTRTYHHSLFNNVLVNHKVMMDINYPSHRSGPQRLDHNVYDASTDEFVFSVNGASEVPPPWSSNEFFDLVDSDLVDSDLTSSKAVRELSKSESRNGGDKARLTLDQWQTFWSAHGLPNDKHSVLSEGVSVSYIPDSQELTLVIPFDPAGVGSVSRKPVESDFWENPIPRNGHALPGPFQNLKQGTNVLSIWDGLPLLDEGVLPK